MMKSVALTLLTIFTLSTISSAQGYRKNINLADLSGLIEDLTHVTAPDGGECKKWMIDLRGLFSHAYTEMTERRLSPLDQEKFKVNMKYYNYLQKSLLQASIINSHCDIIVPFIRRLARIIVNMAEIAQSAGINFDKVADRLGDLQNKY